VINVDKGTVLSRVVGCEYVGLVVWIGVTEDNTVVVVWVGVEKDNIVVKGGAGNVIIVVAGKVETADGGILDGTAEEDSTTVEDGAATEEDGARVLKKVAAPLEKTKGHTLFSQQEYGDTTYPVGSPSGPRTVA
jgi:hypothetical protein